MSMIEYINEVTVEVAKDMTFSLNFELSRNIVSVTNSQSLA